LTRSMTLRNWTGSIGRNTEASVALSRDDVLPLARELGKQAGELLTLAKQLEQLDHHPAWVGERVREVARDLRLAGERIRMLQGYQGGPPKVRQVTP
jgi:hypothetical protein